MLRYKLVLIFHIFFTCVRATADKNMIAILKYDKQSMDYVGACTGSLLNSHLVVVSTHCLQSDTLYGVVGVRSSLKYKNYLERRFFSTSIRFQGVEVLLVDGKFDERVKKEMIIHKRQTTKCLLFEFAYINNTSNYSQVSQDSHLQCDNKLIGIQVKGEKWEKKLNQNKNIFFKKIPHAVQKYLLNMEKISDRKHKMKISDFSESIRNKSFLDQVIKPRSPNLNNNSEIVLCLKRSNVARTSLVSMNASFYMINKVPKKQECLYYIGMFLGLKESKMHTSESKQLFSVNSNKTTDSAKEHSILLKHYTKNKQFVDKNLNVPYKKHLQGKGTKKLTKHKLASAYTNTIGSTNIPNTIYPGQLMRREVQSKENEKKHLNQNKKILPRKKHFKKKVGTSERKDLFLPNLGKRLKRLTKNKTKSELKINSTSEFQTFSSALQTNKTQIKITNINETKHFSDVDDSMEILGVEPLTSDENSKDLLNEKLNSQINKPSKPINYSTSDIRKNSSANILARNDNITNVEANQNEKRGSLESETSSKLTLNDSQLQNLENGNKELLNVSRRGYDGILKSNKIGKIMAFDNVTSNYNINETIKQIDKTGKSKNNESNSYTRDLTPGLFQKTDKDNKGANIEGKNNQRDNLPEALNISKAIVKNVTIKNKDKNEIFQGHQKQEKTYNKLNLSNSRPYNLPNHNTGLEKDLSEVNKTFVGELKSDKITLGNVGNVVSVLKVNETLGVSDEGNLSKIIKATENNSNTPNIQQTSGKFQETENGLSTVKVDMFTLVDKKNLSTKEQNNQSQNFTRPLTNLSDVKEKKENYKIEDTIKKESNSSINIKNKKEYLGPQITFHKINLSESQSYNLKKHTELERNSSKLNIDDGMLKNNASNKTGDNMMSISNIEEIELGGKETLPQTKNNRKTTGKDLDEDKNAQASEIHQQIYNVSFNKTEELIDRESLESKRVLKLHNPQNNKNPTNTTDTPIIKIRYTPLTYKTDKGIMLEEPEHTSSNMSFAEWKPTPKSKLKSSHTKIPLIKLRIPGSAYASINQRVKTNVDESEDEVIFQNYEQTTDIDMPEEENRFNAASIVGYESGFKSFSLIIIIYIILSSGNV